MKRTLHKIGRGLVLAVAAVGMFASVDAVAAPAWEQLYHLDAASAVLVASDGTMYMSDFRDNMDGGIYISHDSGITWEMCDVRDYGFQKFVEIDGYVFALGEACRIARTADSGETWDMLNYASAISDYVDDKALDASACYGLQKYNGKLYACDFNGGGVIVSEDMGETWAQTDRASQIIRVGGVEQLDCYYNLVTYGDHLYSFGFFSLHRFSDQTNVWEVLPINSNCMATASVIKDRIVAGRAIEDTDVTQNFLQSTTNGYDWESLGRPAGHSYNNVRCVIGVDTTIVVCQPNGYSFYTTNWGNEWARLGGLPALYPLELAADGKYVYTTVYCPYPNKEAGLYRLPIDELTSGIDCMPVEVPGLDVTIEGDRLTVAAEGRVGIVVFNAAGRMVRVPLSGNSADLSELAAGVYTYSVIGAEGAASGKFVK